MVSCVLFNCNNSSTRINKKRDGITFHRFPRDKDRRRLWELAVNRTQDWRATPSSAVCSEHFLTDDFYITESGLRKLSMSAVPSINISPCQDQEPTISIMEPIDIKPTDTEEVICLKHQVKRLKIIADSRKNKLNLMRQQQKRLLMKVDRLKCMMKHLITNKQANGKTDR